MQLDIFSEVQKARSAWTGDHEQAVLEETLEQARLADELGFGCWWLVEHHAATEFSYSSSPELLLTAISQQTQRLRLGHSGVLAPFNVNHPIRIAERAATLDRLSHGRVEVGYARSGGMEWETFAVDGEASLNEVRECMQMTVGMWTEQPFRWKSARWDIPDRDIVPKPLQKPHPPMWQTVTSPTSFQMAGSLGVGALATTLLTPLDTMSNLLGMYREAQKDAQPVGKRVNEQTAVFTFVHCAETTREAIASGAGLQALWYVNSAPRVFKVPTELFYGAIRGEYLKGDAASITARDNTDDPTDLSDPVPVVALLKRQAAGQHIDPEEIYETLAPIESVIIGDVETCRKKMQKYRDVGVDRLMCFFQIGALPQEAILRSMRLVGRDLLHAFGS